MDMKKEYTTPEVEKVEFNYREQVVASSSTSCESSWVNIGESYCQTGNKHQEYLS